MLALPLALEDLTLPCSPADLPTTAAAVPLCPAVTVVGTAVLMVVAGLAAYQYRRRKRLELERRARLEREALEQLEQQRRLARLGEGSLQICRKGSRTLS